MNVFPRNDIDDLTDNSTEIKFQITDWFIPETDKNRSDYESSDDYTIYIYGTNSEGVTICTKVINFEPFFYVKPPKEWEELDDKKLSRKRMLIESVFNVLKKHMNLEHTRHRSPVNFLVHIIACVTAYVIKKAYLKLKT